MKKITWEKYASGSYHTIINNRHFYIFNDHMDNGESVFHISEFTNKNLYGSIGFDFKSFDEAERFLLENISEDENYEL